MDSQFLNDWMCSPNPGLNLRHLGLSLSEGDTVFQSGDAAVIVRRPRFVRIDHQGSPQCELAIRILKFCGHHAKDRVRIAIELNLRTKDRWVGRVPAFPKTVAQHHLVLNRSIFFCKHSAQYRADAEHTKNTGCGPAAEDTFGCTISCNVEILDQLCDTNLVENRILSAPVEIIGHTNGGRRVPMADRH